MKSRWKSGAMAFALVVLTALMACSPESQFGGRQEVGTVPSGFAEHAVGTPADAAAYVEGYAKALGLTGLVVSHVVSLPDRYLVYVAEQESGRAAFSLEISPQGAVKLNTFPAMQPEMMWNQKYGHEAPLRETEVEMDLSAEEAASRLRQAVAGEAGVEIGAGTSGYGYYRFPLVRAGQTVGDAVVNAVNGEIVWSLFPEPAKFWGPASKDR